jgi:hypothetical protein
MAKNMLIIGCILLVSNALSGQKVSFYSIYEQRSSGESYFGNRCDFGLRVEGPEIAQYKQVKVAKLTKAVDDLGTDMLNEDDVQEMTYEEISQDAVLNVRTGLPARKATKIKELSGELHLYNPTEANGGILKISNYQSSTNKNLIPENHGITLLYVTKESLAQFAKAHKQKNENDLKKMSEKERSIADILVDASESSYDFGDDENQAMFIIDGKMEALVDLYFEDAKGQKIDRNGYMKTGGRMTYYYEEKPAPGWKLVLNIETPASVKVVPFSLKDIVLP